MKKLHTLYLFFSLSAIFFGNMACPSWAQPYTTRMATSSISQRALPWATSSPKHEVRAVWLTTIGGIDWPHSYAQTYRSAEKQKAELRSILDRLQQAGINTVLLQTRIRATTIYPSQYEPWDGCLSGHPGKSPGYDALQYAISQCHQRGMELHAWVVAIPVGAWNGTGCRLLRKRHAALVRKIGTEGFMNPENPGTATYLADLCAEITRRYDIDGIHLDYIRYPETWNIRVTREQGRNYITNIVRLVSQRVKALKPWVKMSCAPIGKHDDLTRYPSHGWNAFTRVCQDAQGWLHDGLMDELFPMMYFRNEQFFPFAIDWAEERSGRIVAPGLGIYFLSPKEKNWSLDDITREMEVLRNLKLGHAFFRSRFFTDNTKGIYDFACHFNRIPALVPPMTWIQATPPPAPTHLQLQPYKDGRVQLLTWSPSDTDTLMTRYNVYSSDTWPVDVTRPEHLVAIRRQRWQLMVPAGKKRYYAVTATDRYGNESTPLQQPEPSNTQGRTLLSALSQHPLLECNGYKLMLPPQPTTLDAPFITIENIYGRLVDTRPYTSRGVDVSSLSNGVYVVRTLGKKGVTHRIGWFLLKR